MLNNNIHIYKDRRDMRALFDWVEFTLPLPSELSSELVDSDVYYVFDVLNINMKEFKQCKTGMNGYKKRLRFNNITILYDGTGAMGIHVIMTGQGCRMYEEYQKRVNDANDDIGIWFDLFARILPLSEKFSRVDAAVDDFKTYFTIKQLADKIEDGVCTSLFDRCRIISGFKISTGSNTGKTIYLGSDSSDLQIVCYDKYLERYAKGHLDQIGDMKAWNRFEVRYADDHAIQLIQKFMAGENLGELIHGTIHKYFNVLQPNLKDKNRSRWELWRPWARFLGAVEKVRFNCVKPERTVLDTVKYTEKFLSRVIAKYYAAHDNNLECLEPLIAMGIMKFTDKDAEDLNQFRQAMEFESYQNSAWMIEENEDNQIISELERRSKLKQKKSAVKVTTD